MKPGDAKGAPARAPAPKATAPKTATSKAAARATRGQAAAEAPRRGKTTSARSTAGSSSAPKAAGGSAARTKPAAKGSESKTAQAAAASAKGVSGAAAAKGSAGAKPKVTAAKAGAKAKPAAAKDAKLASSAKSAASGSARRGKVDLSSPRSVAAAATAGTTDAQGYVVINGRRVRMISTKDIKVAKKPRSAEAKSEAAAAGPDIASIKTRLSKKELDQYRQLLLSRRADILGLVQGMEQEALRSEGGNLSHMPIHMADIGSDTADQDFALNLAEKERQTITEIDAALQRISDGSYGVCQATGKPIPKARLDAKPWAKYTIEAARMVESGHRF